MSPIIFNIVSNNFGAFMCSTPFNCGELVWNDRTVQDRRYDVENTVLDNPIWKSSGEYKMTCFTTFPNVFFLESGIVK